MVLAMRIGIDFDNTIITYDEVFLAAARERGLIDASFRGAQAGGARLHPAACRTARSLGCVCRVRSTARASAGAMCSTGVDAFLRRCSAQRVPVVIVSHKTEFGHHDPDRVNLRDAALDWMTAQGFFRIGGFGMRPDNVYFESTRAEKLARIAALGCTHFIDDLSEVLTDPAFPPGVTRILFADEPGPRRLDTVVCPTWRQIEEQIFRERA